MRQDVFDAVVLAQHVFGSVEGVQDLALIALRLGLDDSVCWMEENDPSLPHPRTQRFPPGWEYRGEDDDAFFAYRWCHDGYQVGIYGATRQEMLARVHQDEMQHAPGHRATSIPRWVELEGCRKRADFEAWLKAQHADALALVAACVDSEARRRKETNDE